MTNGHGGLIMKSFISCGKEGFNLDRVNPTKDFKILRFLDRFKKIFEAQGIDYDIMRNILRLKFIMGQRNSPTIMQNYSKKNGKSDDNLFNRALIMYGIIGLFMVPIMFMKSDIFIKLNILFSFAMIMLLMVLMSDFSSVILDVKDKNILLPRPVDAKTINTAKVIFIAVYLTEIVGVLLLPTILASIVEYNALFAVVFLLQVILIVFFMIVVTAFLYYFILSYFDGEKLKDVINYFQIVFTIAIFVANQLIGRIFNMVDIHFQYIPKWWHYFIPSIWFSAQQAILLGKITPQYISLAIIGIIVPIIMFVIYVKNISQSFEDNLQKLNSNNGGKGRKTALAQEWENLTANLLCNSNEEKAFYKFSRNMISSERTLKLKIYPSLAMAIAMPFIMIMSFSFDEIRNAGIRGVIASLSKGNYHMSIYLSIAMMAGVISFLAYSDNYKGAWIYRVVPIDTPAPACRGALKGFISKSILPFIVLAIGFLALCGTRILADLVLIFLQLFFITIFNYNMFTKYLPFYKAFTNMDQSANAGKVMLSLMITAVLGILHYLVARKIGVIAVCIYALVMLFLNVILWNRAFKFSWNKIAL